MSAPQRIGLFGGTFDPVHFGHLRPAMEMAEVYALTALHLMPNHRPAHRDQPTASTQQRIAMLELATAQLPKLVVDPREALRDEPTYTFDTLSELKAEQPEAQLIFFMGLDAFSAFETWYRWQEIIELANLVIINRPNAVLSDFASDLLQSTPSIEMQSVTQLAISATDIRQRIAAGKSVDFLLPERVKQYIVDHELYLTQ
jgi:nicotinate-nucleotide adenylyltransferase